MISTPQYKSAKEIFNEAILECENSQLSMTEDSQTQTQTQTQTDLTADNELTQLAECATFATPVQQKFDPREVAWGRLIAEEGEGRHELLPRDPLEENREKAHYIGVTILGCLKGILPSDKFNEYRIGRNSKMDIRPPQTSKQDSSEDEYQIHKWAYSMISNRHCSVYCMLKSGEGLDVFIEDSSGNGTIVNGTTLLKKGEKRLLHSGDEICLINTHILRKKIRNKEVIQKVQRRYTYVFVNVFQQQVCSSGPSKRKGEHFITPFSKKRKGIVDVRAILSKSFAQQTRDQISTSSAGENSGRESVSQEERIEQYYDFRDVLGSGTCGEVKRAISRETGKEYAVKVVKLTGRNRGANMSEQASAALQAEASILKALDHPYIVKLYDVFITPGIAVYFVMELMTGGDLFDRIVKKGNYTEVESRRAMRRLLNSIYYLHEKKSLVHRDLKPENILCMSSSNDVDLKLTDFGLAKNVTDEGLKTFCGTPQYFAPEVLRRNYTIAGKGRYGKEADMWSLGVILYILLSGIPPFDISEGCDDIANGKISFSDEEWAGVSSTAIDLVRKLLVIDPKKRLSVKDACEHPWILMNDGDTHSHPLDNPVAPMRQHEKDATTTKTLSEKKTKLLQKIPVESSSSNLPKQSLSPYKNLNLNSRSNKFREAIIDSSKKETESKRNLNSELKLVNFSKEKKMIEKSRDEQSLITPDTKAAELSDDEIQSQFSDSESISQGAENISTSVFTNCNKKKGHITNNIMGSDDLKNLNSSNISKDLTKNEIKKKNSKPKIDDSKGGIGNISDKSNLSQSPSRQSKRTTGKQTTLSGWFQKKEVQSTA